MRLMRSDGLKCNCVMFEMKDFNFHHQSHQRTLEESTNITSAIYENAYSLFKEAWNKIPLRLIGIRTSRITEEPYTQLNLFNSKKMKN